MANILLLDDNDVAGRAMHGIIARGRHTCIVATKADDAWRHLREALIIDLVFIETNLPANAGMMFLQKLREDSLMKLIPVVIYTSAADVTLVKKALALKAQNYLVKPYNESSIYGEITKAVANPWRNLHFEEARSFCAQLGLSQEALATLRRNLMGRLDECAKAFPDWATGRENATVFEQIDAVSADAEAAGVWGVVDYFRELRTQAEASHWTAFKTCAEILEYASRLIFCQLNPSYIPNCLRSHEERVRLEEAAQRAHWSGIDVDANGPAVCRKKMEQELIALPGCPVIDSVAAAFLMTADGNATSIALTMERAANDPGLSAQVLVAANKDGDADNEPTDDPRAAVSRLGVLKLNALAKALPVVHERHLHVPPLTWTDFWMFQVGVGKLSQFICDYLELSYLKSKAYTAGLMHDLGVLLLVRLHPFALEPMVRYAHSHKVPLREAERKYLGMTTREMGAVFAESAGLPAAYRHVIQWVETPELATEDVDLVAIVSLARHLCLHNHIGCCGDLPEHSPPPVAQTSAWQLLQPRLFPSFELPKFETQAHACCVELHQELLGRTNRDPGRRRFIAA